MKKNSHFVPSKEGKALPTKKVVPSLQPQKREKENSQILNDLILAPTQDPLSVGNRLSHFVENWKNITDDKFVLNVIKEGYRLDFKKYPPLVRSPINESNMSSNQLLILESEIAVMLEKGVIEEVQTQSSPGFYSQIFLVPKKENKSLRPVIDLSCLSQFLDVKTFKMENQATILTVMQDSN